MNQTRALNWLGDPTDRRIAALRQLFLKALEDQSKNIINYYDFLLVAKKLNFRFEESSHLMDLRKYFFNHKNQLHNKKLTNLLCFEEETLKEMTGERPPDKIIIRFKVGGEEIESIKEVTNQDEQMVDSDEDNVLPYSPSYPVMAKEEQNQEYKEKLTIILSIKVSEMVKKVRLLVEGTTTFYQNQEKIVNILNVFDQLSLNQLPYQIFRKGVVGLLKKLQPQFSKEKLTMSEDDIKAVYRIIQFDRHTSVKRSDLSQLSDQSEVARKISKFYQQRINKRMVKNTLFKLGKNNNSIQIYHVKNASVLQFKNIQEGLLDTTIKVKEKSKNSRTPHFGPIKGQGLRQSPSKQTLPTAEQTNRHNHSSLSTYKRADDNDNLNKQRSKIQRIIRTSKQQKKKPGKDTIANKLRKLFIHKVILPRQKLLQEQKMKYGQNRSMGSNMMVKLM